MLGNRYKSHGPFEMHFKNECPVSHDCLTTKDHEFTILADRPLLIIIVNLGCLIYVQA